MVAFRRFRYNFNHDVMPGKHAWTDKTCIPFRAKYFDATVNTALCHGAPFAHNHNKAVPKMFPSCVVGGSRTTVLLVTRCFQQQQQQFRYGLKTASAAARFLRTGTCVGQFDSFGGVRDDRFGSFRSYTSANTGSSCLKMTGAAKKYQTVERGAPNSTDYRVFFSEY